MGNSLTKSKNIKFYVGKKLLNLFFILFIFTSLAFSDDFENAKTAYKDGDFEKAMNIYNNFCDQKNAKGCVMVGFMYERGIGVKQDFIKALKFYKKTCEYKFAFGCSIVGTMYQNGYGIKQDLNKAFRFYNTGCELKFPSDCLQLGDMYRNSKDFEKAREFYKKACELNLNLGCDSYKNLNEK